MRIDAYFDETTGTIIDVATARRHAAADEWRTAYDAARIAERERLSEHGLGDGRMEIGVNAELEGWAFVMQFAGAMGRIVATQEHISARHDGKVPDGLLPFCGDPSPYVGDSCQLPLGHDGPHRSHPCASDGWGPDPIHSTRRRTT
jgi:hypothetical protein